MLQKPQPSDRVHTCCWRYSPAHNNCKHAEPLCPGRPSTQAHLAYCKGSLLPTSPEVDEENVSRTHSTPQGGQATPSEDLWRTQQQRGALVQRGQRGGRAAVERGARQLPAAAAAAQVQHHDFGLAGGHQPAVPLKAAHAPCARSSQGSVTPRPPTTPVLVPNLMPGDCICLTKLHVPFIEDAFVHAQYLGHQD